MGLFIQNLLRKVSSGRVQKALCTIVCLRLGSLCVETPGELASHQEQVALRPGPRLGEEPQTPLKPVSRVLQGRLWARFREEASPRASPVRGCLLRALSHIVAPLPM